MNKDQLLDKLAKQAAKLTDATKQIEALRLERDVFFAQSREHGIMAAYMREAVEDISKVPKGVMSGKRMRTIATIALAPQAHG
mgnify:FL=1